MQCLTRSFFPVTTEYPLLLVPLGLNVIVVDGYYEVLIPSIALNRTYYFIERSDQQWYAVERTVCDALIEAIDGIEAMRCVFLRIIVPSFRLIIRCLRLVRLRICQ